MIEFNDKHVAADISGIKPKIEKIKNLGKVFICGVLISSALLLSGCDQIDVAYEEKLLKKEEIKVDTSTAIIFENGNALVVDVSSFKKLVSHESGLINDFDPDDRIWIIIATSGQKIIVNQSNIQIINGINSHEVAVAVANSLVAPTGKVTCYDDLDIITKTKHYE